MARLELSGIEKRFGGVVALAGASLSAEAGEIHAICGENGAGKSTLLKVLSGVYPHGTFRGTITLDGRALQLASTAAARAAGIAIVHQELMLAPAMSVADNLFLGREPTRWGFTDDLATLAEARRLLDRFGLGDEIDAAQPVGELGIGRQQMVEIARALADRAEVLILDEPTAALTSDECERLHAWLRELRAQGTTCLYVSHRMDEIFGLCDRITVLRDGRTAGTLVAAETRPAKVVALMVGRELPAHVPSAARAGGRPLVEVDGLRVGRAVNGVAFSVAAGEIVALAGALGSGRTALLSTLFGCAEAPVSGTVRIDGTEGLPRSPREAIARGLAFVPEDRKGRGLVLGLTVQENLALPKNGAGSLFGFVDDLAEEAEAQARIDALHVRGAATAEVATLSGGNQQKVVLGKWLTHPPKLLLLDEPTRGVDVGAREEIYALLTELTRRGVAILVASSDLEEVLRLADRILVLRDGRIAGTLGPGATQEELVRLSTGALSPVGARCA